MVAWWWILIATLAGIIFGVLATSILIAASEADPRGDDEAGVAKAPADARAETLS